MDKLDIAVQWNGEDEHVETEGGWVVWSTEDGVVGYLTDNQVAYETQLSNGNTMVLRGVVLGESEKVKSIDSVDFESFESIADYPEEFIAWIESIANIKPVFKPETVEDNYDPVTKPAGYQLDSGKELKDVYPDLFGKEATIAGYKQATVKYLMRYRDKNGEQDLNKAIQYIGLIKELEYGNEFN
ncbi:DUF3310 domain-containing protein [Weissella ceti]|uniref:DUF3310 domain-containing protein n=1 Tax=Weissella ceti TaxID=759620 RepID=A0ABT3E540_9LACO|nr:DUF3310 domain-containing protein [Weissella ceti]MCW0953023.1 DUF3310 domain-containing protein [Weissella ceti]QVK11569.1 DUF3310 domain-containing protein [Weissella ceti]